MAREVEMRDVLQAAGGIGTSFAELWDDVWTRSGVDPTLLELCRLRTAQLLRCSSELAAREERARAGLSEEKIALLSTYATSPLFSARERACVSYAERIVGDPNGITPDEIAAIREHLSDAERAGLTLAVTLFEGLSRSALVLGAAPRPAVRAGLAGRASP